MRILIILLLFTIPTITNSQSLKLAQQYYRDGEYEKAGTVYKKLFDKNKSDYYFEKYIDCIISLEDYPLGIKELKKQIKKKPNEASYNVTYAKILEADGDQENAEIQYREAIEKVQTDKSHITRLANAFLAMARYDEATEVYEKGIKNSKDANSYAYNLGNLYLRKGNEPKMITQYLISIKVNPNLIKSIQNIFQRNLTEDGMLELQGQLYEKLSDDDDEVYVTLLTWVFLQGKDYAGALRQVKALDKRNKEDGRRVYDIGIIALKDKDYITAIDAFEYLTVEKKGRTANYIDAKQMELLARRYQILDQVVVEKNKLDTLAQKYALFLDEFPISRATAQTVMEYAQLEAVYRNNTSNAVELLNKLLELTSLDQNLKDEAKLMTADYYLISGERWESTLLYSQVDKARKDDILGHEARFKNAKLSYYFGDFEWAQAQFSVLKASTSKLIANDALELSVFITENLGLDTIVDPMEMYARSELLLFQHKYDEAFSTLDSINTVFPRHELEDDIYYAKAKIYTKLGNTAEAKALYNKIIKEFPEGIRADNSMFLLAELHEKLDENEEAQKLYEKLFMDYSNSTLAMDARKKFRQLRGDKGI